MEILWDLHFIYDKYIQIRKKRKAESLPLHFRA